jgi:hypothetical protein
MSSFSAQDNHAAQQRDRLAATESQLRGIPARFGGQNPLYRYINQTAHGFDVGDIVCAGDSGWGAANGFQPACIVAAVPNPNAFVIAKPGASVRLPGLTKGTTYYVGGSGALAPYDWAVRPAGQIILHATSADEGIALSDWHDGITNWEGVVGILQLPDTWGLLTPLTNNGSIALANASALATARVFGVISGALKAGSAGTLWYIVRRAGNVGADGLLTHFVIPPFDTPGFAEGTYYVGTTDGTVTTTAPTSPNIANPVLEVYGGGTEVIPGCISPLKWEAINNKPAAFPPSGTISVTSDATDTGTGAALVFSGSIGSQTWTFYEKRPKFNAKWLLTAELASAVGSVSGSSAADLFLWWDKTNSKWTTFEWFQGSPVVGDVNVYDPAASDANGKMSTVAAGTACSLFGRSANSAGLPAAIAAAANNRIMTRKADALVFSDEPLLTRSSVDFSLCTVATITATTTAPTASGVKGQMHFIY